MANELIRLNEAPGSGILLDDRGAPVLSSRRLQELALRVNSSDILSRGALADVAGQMFGGRMDTRKELGYRRVLTFRDFLAKYTRQDIAGRIVDAAPQTTWRRGCEVVELDGDGNPQPESPWTEAAREFLTRLRAFHYFERADRLAGIGTYSIIVIGSGKAERFEDPIEEDGITGADDVAFLQVYSQASARVERYDEDAGSERFGQPLLYRLDIGAGSQSARRRQRRKRRFVHWSRVVHFVDDPLEDDLEGLPRLQRAMDRLDDLLKVAGGSAQAFWNIAFGWLHADVPHEVPLKPAEGGGGPLDPLVEQLYEAFFGTRRVVGTRSTKLDIIGGEAVDPTGVWTILKELIATAADMPQRILFGSERGELASSQDLAEWLGRMTERQGTTAEPHLRTFLDRMIAIKALKAPARGYECQWPSLFELPETEKARAVRDRGRGVRDVQEARVLGLRITEGEARELAGLPPDVPEDGEGDQLDREDDDASLGDEDLGAEGGGGGSDEEGAMAAAVGA